MKKMAKAMYGKIMMKGGASKMKKYKLGSAVNNGPGNGKTDDTSAPQSISREVQENPISKKIAMNALGIKTPKPPKPRYPSENVRSSKYGGTAKTKMKTGGMVNSNAKLSADKTPGSKGTKVGLNKKINKPKK